MEKLKLEVHPPHEDIAKHVRRILISTASDLNDEIIPIVPTGFSYFTYSRFPIRLNYSKSIIESNEQLYLAGQLDKELPYFTIKGDFLQVGLELLPTSMSYFFNTSGREITDNGVFLKEKAPELAEQLRKRLSSVKDSLKLAEIMQEVLIERLSVLNPIDILDDTLKIIYRKNGNIRISELASTVNVSERHFRRIFRQVIGVSPKKYCKIIQFNSVFEAIRSGNEDYLFDLMIECGYYDQAHFINDFKTYLGQSPSEFLESGHTFLKSYIGSVRS